MYKKLIFIFVLMFMLVGCNPARPENNYNPNSLRMPTLTISEDGVASWGQVEDAEYWEYIINFGLYNSEENPSYEIVKTENTSVQLEYGDTITVYGCSGERKGTSAEATYYKNGSLDFDGYFYINKLYEYKNSISDMINHNDLWNEEVLKAYSEYQTSYEQAQTIEEQNFATQSFVKKIGSIESYQIKLNDYETLLEFVHKFEWFINHDNFYCEFSKTDYAEFSKMLYEYKKDIDELKNAYNNRVKVIYLYEYISDFIYGIEDVLILKDQEIFQFSNYTKSIEGYSLSIIEYNGNSYSESFEIQDYVATLRVIFEPNTYKITYDMGSFSGVTECISETDVVMNTEVSLPLPYCTDLFFDKWVDEDGNEYKNNILFNAACDITLTAKWSNELITTNNINGIVIDNSRINEDGTYVYTTWGVVEKAIYNGYPILYIRVDGRENGYGFYVSNPKIRSYGSSVWETFDSENSINEYFEIMHSKYDNGDCILSKGAKVLVQGIYNVNEGQIELIDSPKVIKYTNGDYINSAGLNIYSLHDYTYALKDANSFSEFKNNQNILVTLNNCTIIGDKADGYYDVKVDGSSLTYKLSFKGEAMSSTILKDYETSQSIFNNNFTIKAILQYYEDKDGNCQVILIPCEIIVD